MENASKALIIAGGILLAMMILALMVYLGTSITDMAESEDKRTLAEQTEEFNKSYLSYNKSRVYGTDVITVYNKAKDNNEKYKNNSNYRVEIIVLDESDRIISVENTQDFKMSIFTSEEPGYNNDTGRINKMTFKKIDVDI